jgi:type II secretory pathway pseudopilin PulG
MTAMLLNTPSKNDKTIVKRRGQAGFSMVEMCIAMVILFIGLLATASAISYALMVSNRGRSITNSKLLVMSVLEQMETLRNTKQLTFGQIANTGQVDNTGAGTPFLGFPTNEQQVSKDPGADGIFGTADDMTSAGPDGIYGNSNDVPNDSTLAVRGYARTIKIETISSNIKKITVTLTYPGMTGSKEKLEVSSYLNNDAQANYIN